MTDVRAGNDDDLDEDRLPWLEPVEEDDERGGPSFAKILVSVIIGLVALGLVITGVYWLRNGAVGPGGGGPELIEAEKGDYKVKPADPGGLKVEGSGDTSLAASEGAETSGKLDMDAVPEAPVAKPPAPEPKAAPAPVPARAAAPKAAPAPAPTPEPALAPGSRSIQLGAFSTSGAANAAWKSLSGRFKYLEPLNHYVIPVTVNGRTLYRLRASGPDANSLCGRLRVAGESCVTIN